MTMRVLSKSGRAKGEDRRWPLRCDTRFPEWRGKARDLGTFTDGDTLRVGDRWMRYSGKYTYAKVENARARCTFGNEGVLGCCRCLGILSC